MTKGVKYAGIVPEKDLKVPMFPAEKPNLDEFRKWLRAFAKHCSRLGDFQCTELVIEAIRKTEHPLDEYELTRTMLDESQSQRSLAYADGPHVTITAIWSAKREKEFYEGIEYALDGKCSDIIGEVGRGKG